MDTDLIGRMLLQLVTITAGAMALSEWLTIPIGTTSPEPNKGSRKRLNCLIYATLMALVAWRVDWVQYGPGVEALWEAVLASLVLAVCSTGVAWGLVAAKKGFGGT